MSYSTENNGTNGIDEIKKNLMEKSSTAAEAFQRLSDIIMFLRKECPWDRCQTHESLKVCMLEEAYEVCDAITEGDMDNLREELGDVLLQVVFHGNMCEENNLFTIKDIIDEECDKMIRRHPHIFAKDEMKSVDKVLEKWENIKSDEHGFSSYTEKLESVPKFMPALMRSEKVQKKAASAGFDWDDVSGAIDKLYEEIGELKEAFSSGNSLQCFEETGDLLFSVVNVSRFMKISPEMALNASTEKFVDRFGKMEQLAVSQGKKLEDMTLQEMDALWDIVKKQSKNMNNDE